MGTKLNGYTRPVLIDRTFDSMVVVPVMQGSKNAYTINVNVYDKGMPYTLQTDYNITYRLQGVRSDGKPIFRDAYSVSGNTIVFNNIDEYITCIASPISLHVSIWDDENDLVEIINTPIMLQIERDDFMQSNIINDDQYSSFVNMMNSFRSALTNQLVINDDTPSTTTGYSGTKINDMFNNVANLAKRNNDSAILANNVNISTLKSGVYATTPSNLPDILTSREELSSFSGYGSLLLFNNEYPFIMYVDVFGKTAIWASNTSTWIVLH